MRAFLATITRNPLSLVGTAITTASALVILTLFALGLFGMLGSPYIGILAYLILPAIFVFGLILIPIGVARQRRRERREAETGEAKPPFPIINLNRPHTQKVALTVFGLTLVNIIIIAVATYEGVEIMDSTEFCGTTCHTVMKPEYTAYRLSPHARVACVDCHIGPGADWFVKSKLSGAWQVVSVAFDLYPRPIPTPIENLRPARETCEQCHWPNKFTGDRLEVITEFADDEENTPEKTVLLIKVGGIQGREAKGIHWHVDPNIEIRYRANEERTEIYDVLLVDDDGNEQLFQADPSEAHDGLPWRVMDCIDCHNRPTHIYHPAPVAVNQAMASGRLPTDLPYFHEQALEIITQEYPSQPAARTAIEEKLVTYYEKNYPDLAAEKRAEIVAAGKELGAIYSENVFPLMNVGWDTYPNHIGHEYSPGCWRCHNDVHETEDGEVITQDCDLCHTILADEEEQPEILDQLNP